MQTIDQVMGFRMINNVNLNMKVPTCINNGIIPILKSNVVSRPKSEVAHISAIANQLQCSV